MAKNSGYRPTRRKFVQSLAMGAGLCAGGAGFRVWGNGLEPYEGKLLVTLQLDGGADVTQLCDPKVNTPGEPKINNWADTADPGEAGNILYAPIADNANFFNRFGADMVVVNGVDAQTNSHQTGRLYNWTGSNAEGRPSLTALHAAANTPDQPLAYSVYGGGTSRTAGIITYNRFDDVSRLRELTRPTQNPWNPDRQMRPDLEISEAQRLAA
ncbi:MAG: ribulose phosphate epimerase, partial [Luminiphilus sp.]